MLQNTTFRKLDVFPSSGEEWAIPTLLGPLESTNLNHYEGPNRAGVSLSSPEEGNKSRFIKFFLKLFRIPDYE
jgi:hypothetical protein